MKAGRSGDKKDGSTTAPSLVEVEIGRNVDKDGVSRRKSKQLCHSDSADEELDAPLLKKHEQHGSGGSGQQKRWASLDVVRGISIFIMLVVHVFMDTLDYENLFLNITTGPIVNVICLIVYSIFGGCAGLFLLCSAVGNMISTRKSLEKHSPLSIVKRQVMGGFTLLFVAMVSEAFIGNHGVMGELVRNLNKVSEAPLDKWKYQAYHMETIHTIAWCVILNSITQYFISKLFDIKTETNKVCLVYWGLVVVVLFLTPKMWSLASSAIPGYPFDINPTTGQQQYLPMLGVSEWYEFILYFFINPVAAPFEPVFPYLATSYVGSIIGLKMTQSGSEFDRSFLRRFWLIGMGIFIVGSVGLGNLLYTTGKFYYALWDHRSWTAEKGLPGGWFWQYLLTNGVGLTLLTYFLRLMEFRGANGAKQSLGATLFFRRLGNLPLSVYILQWFYVLVYLFVLKLYGKEPYEKVGWSASWVTVICTMVFFNTLLMLWAKIGFIGSLEWLLSTFKALLSPRKSDKNKKWWELGWIESEGMLFNVSPVYFKSTEEDDRRFLNQEVLACCFLPFVGFIVGPRRFLYSKKRYPEWDMRKYWVIWAANCMFQFYVWNVINATSIEDIVTWATK